MNPIKEIMNFAKGKKNDEQYHFVSYHVDDNDNVIIDMAGTKDDISENVYMTIFGTKRKADKPELEKALKEYISTHEIKPFSLSMAYDVITNYQLNNRK